MKGNFWRKACTVVVLMLAVGMARAQLSTATMFGTVTDPTGAAIPNAKATLVETDTNFTRTFTTRSDGSYREEFLPIGPYKITVEAPGFKTLQRSGIVLSVMQDAELSLALEVGTTDQTVTRMFRWSTWAVLRWGGLYPMWKSITCH